MVEVCFVGVEATDQGLKGQDLGCLHKPGKGNKRQRVVLKKVLVKECN